MNKIVIPLTFIAGCAVGIYGTKQYYMKKYEAIAEKDIESVKEAFRSEKDISEAAEFARNKPEISTYTEKLHENGYVNYSGISSDKEKEPIVQEPVVEEVDIPYVISPDDFGEYEDYNQISLTYYSDGILTEGDEVIDDADDIVGDFSDHFGEYEDDSVHIRNDRLRTDYEILWDNRTFEEVSKHNPRHIELED